MNGGRYSILLELQYETSKNQNGDYCKGGTSWRERLIRQRVQKKNIGMKANREIYEIQVCKTL